MQHSILSGMTPVVNRRPGKLWAFLQFPLCRLLIGFAAIALLAFPLLAGAHFAHLHGLAFAASHLLAGLVACGVYIVYVRLLERRVPVELALRQLLSQFGKGFAVGAAILGATVLVLWLSGAYHVSGVNTADMLLAFFINALGAALLEEIAVRGVVFRILEEGLGTWLALGISALFFGLLHAMNPGANLRNILGNALEAGVLLAAVYVYARSLWIGIGLHCAWDFFDGGVFGASAKKLSLLSVNIHGPEWLTGGRDGLDASLVAIMICLSAAVVFLLLAWRRGLWLAPFWKRTELSG